MAKVGRRDNAPFRFLDLPPELRNIVYYCLVEEHKYFVVRCPKYKKEWPRQRSVFPYLLAFSRLIQTCRALHYEGAGLMYYQTEFHFLSPDTMKEWFAQIGSMKQYARDISLAYRRKTTWRSGLHFLKTVPALGVLDIGCTYLRMPVPAMANSLKPFMVSRMRHCKTIEQKRAALEVIVARHGRMGFPGIQHRTYLLDEYVAAVKASLCKILKIG